MRYYEITIFDQNTGQVLKPPWAGSLTYPSTYTSYMNGQTLPGALNVEFDIPSAPFATPQQGSWLRIWGISLSEMSQFNSYNLNLKGIIIRGGMQRGLPLANPTQAGLLTQGTIFQPFGRWEGTDQTLEMILLPPFGTNPIAGTNNNADVDIQFEWPANTPIGPAIQSALQKALPTYNVEQFVSPSITNPAPFHAPYQKIQSFAAAIKKLTNIPLYQNTPIMTGGKYAGVEIRVVGKTITAYDGSIPYGTTNGVGTQNSFSNPTIVNFQDVIGQPTWIGPNSLNFKCVLRGDIQVGDYVKLPDTLAVPYVLTTPGAAVPSIVSPSNPAAPASRYNLTFKGTFYVYNVHHFANFRSPNASAWVTSYNATFINDPGALNNPTSP